jgi:hypothetical protein
MKIGFDVQYKPHDAVYAAMRLSDSLKLIGYETTLFSNKIPKHAYGCGWDSLVKTPKHMSYEKWLLGVSHIIWPVPPNKDVVQKVGKSIVTIALAPWDCLPGYSRGAFKICAHVVSPCLENSVTLKKEANIRDVSTIEWDSPVPISKKTIADVNTANPKVLIPLHSSQGLRCDLDSLYKIIEGVQHRSPHAEITISYSPKSMPWSCKESISKFLTKNKLIKLVVDETTCTSSLVLYGQHDIVLWPAEIEGFGLVGIESLYMGTPVIAYDIPPISKIIADGVNGRLVPCNSGGSKGGVMYAEPNPEAFIEIASEAINNKIVTLNKNTSSGRRSARSQFLSQWKRLIEG